MHLDQSRTGGDPGARPIFPPAGRVSENVGGGKANVAAARRVKRDAGLGPFAGAWRGRGSPEEWIGDGGSLPKIGVRMP